MSTLFSRSPLARAAIASFARARRSAGVAAVSSARIARPRARSSACRRRLLASATTACKRRCVVLRGRTSQAGAGGTGARCHGAGFGGDLLPKATAGCFCFAGEVDRPGHVDSEARWCRSNVSRASLSLSARRFAAHVRHAPYAVPVLTRPPHWTALMPRNQQSQRPKRQDDAHGHTSKLWKTDDETYQRHTSAFVPSV